MNTSLHEYEQFTAELGRKHKRMLGKAYENSFTGKFQSKTMPKSACHATTKQHKKRITGNRKFQNSFRNNFEINNAKS